MQTCAKKPRNNDVKQSLVVNHPLQKIMLRQKLTKATTTGTRSGDRPKNSTVHSDRTLTQHRVFDRSNPCKIL